jgi:ABC-type lipoprotein release transport system permease subunit
MTVKDFKKYQALSRCFNKTFGAPSALKSSTETVTVKMVDDTMVSAMFLIVVNFSSEGLWRELRKRYLEEGVEKITETLKKAEQDYEALTGEKLTIKVMQNTISDSLEFINYSLYNPKKTCYFRVFLNAEVD